MQPEGKESSLTIKSNACMLFAQLNRLTAGYFFTWQSRHYVCSDDIYNVDVALEVAGPLFLIATWVLNCRIIFLTAFWRRINFTTYAFCAKQFWLTTFNNTIEFKRLILMRKVSIWKPTGTVQNVIKELILIVLSIKLYGKKKTCWLW